MGDYLDQIVQKVAGGMDPFKKILSYVPGFKGYIDRQNRRDEDKVLRDTIASRFEEQWQRISALQRDFISQGEISLIDDLESAAIKLRTFIDRVRRAPRGYSGLFDAVKINNEELAKIYQYDATLLAMSDEVCHAIDNLQASVGTDGLLAAIRNLVSISQQCLDLYERRGEVVFSNQ
jgi:hypothetical protein